MEQYEANECVKNLVYLDRDLKELERYQLYVLVNANSKKNVTAREIMKLPWDNKFLNETEFEYSEEESESLKEMENSFADMLSKGTLKMDEVNSI